MAKRSRLQIVPCNSTNEAFPSTLNEETGISSYSQRLPTTLDNSRLTLDLSIAVFKFTSLEVPHKIIPFWSRPGMNKSPLDGNSL
jgi:hypothetical protein